MTDWLLALGLAGVTLATRWPYRMRVLPTWDAVQFALAIQQYDIVRHQPHPPGYILFVALARALARVVGDPAASLTLLAIGASAIAVLLTYRLGWALYGRGPALLAGLGLVTSPLFWSQGAAGLPYATEAALATAVALAAWALRAGRPAGLVGSAILLGLAGGIRQPALLLLAPLWLGMAWLGGRRARPLVAGLGVLALTVASWAVPMLWLTGTERYVAAARELYGSTVHATTVAGGGWGRNLVGLAEALVVGLGVFLPVLLWGVRRGAGRLRAGGPRAVLLALWTLPALAVFGLVHLGQHGYLLMILPACYLVVGRTLAGWLAGLARASGPWRVRPVLAGIGVAAALAAQGLFFVAARPVTVSFPAADASWSERTGATLRGAYRFRLWPHTAAGLREAEAVIAMYVDAVRREFDPRDTVLVTELGNSRSYPWFRHATYYLPEYAVYHLRIGGFSPGYLRSRELRSMVAVPERIVPLPLTARRLVWLVDHWDPGLPRPADLEARPLPYGRWLYVVPVTRTALVHAGYRLAPVTASARLR